MSIKPILFSGSMVRAILDGRKTQTRRVLDTACDEPPAFVRCGVVTALDENDNPYRWPKTAATGDLLWVRENWASCTGCNGPENGGVIYQADGTPNAHRWRPSIHMPRWASRLTLEVTDAMVHRVQEIGEEDARAEGFPHVLDAIEFASLRGKGVAHLDKVPCRTWFYELWNSLNAKRGYGWEVNPWVVALTFTVHRCNVDSMERAA
jgi:hypothetical protein